MPGAIEVRETALRSRLEQMRANDEWHLFQNFVLGLLPHNGYQDVRWSAVRHDLGRDGMAVTPQGERCFVAVSFDASLSKVQGLWNSTKRPFDSSGRLDTGTTIF